MITLEEVQTELARFGLRVEPADFTPAVLDHEVCVPWEGIEPPPRYQVVFPDAEDGFGGGVVGVRDEAEAAEIGREYNRWLATIDRELDHPSLFGWVDARLAERLGDRPVD